MYDKSPSLAELLAKEGLSCEKIVTGRIGYIRVENLFEKIKDARWLVFTSKNAVAGFAYNMGECELSAGVKIAVVGKKTQEALRTTCGLKFRNGSRIIAKIKHIDFVKYNNSLNK